MGCWYSKLCKCRGPKKAVKKEEDAVEIKAVSALPSGESAAAASEDDVGAEELSNRTSIANENAILPSGEEQSAPSCSLPSSPTKPNGIHIVVNTPTSAAVRAPPGSSLVHVIRRQDERETAVAVFDDADGDEVGPLPSPRPKRPTLKRMATSELSDNFCEEEDCEGGNEDDDGDSNSHDSVEAIRRTGANEARTQATDSMIAESGSRVTSGVGLLEPANSETLNEVEGGEERRIEVHPCSSVEDQGDENAKVDETRLTVTDEVLPATPSSSSDEEEGSLTSIGVGGDEEMEPIKEEPEEEEKEELEDSRLRNELNNNHETVDNRIVDKSVSSGTSTEDIANMDTNGKSNLTRRRSLADSVHDLQHELEKELELRLGPDIDIGEPPENNAANKFDRGEEKLKNGSSATVELSVSEGQEVKRTSCHVQIGGE